MRILVTGASGFVGSALAPRLVAAGHHVRAFGRSAARMRTAGVPEAVTLVEGDATSGTGLEQALDGVDVAFFLIHAMEGPIGNGDFADLERRSAERFVAAAQAAGTRRVVYLGGPVPVGKEPSRHLGSRLAVEDALLQGFPEAVAFRASIIIGARSRSFRFLVRLVERAPILPLPAWHVGRTNPLDERDLLAYLEAAATSDQVRGPLSLDVPGPDTLSYGGMIERIRDLMLICRPALRLPVSMTSVAAPIAAAIASEEVGLIQPLMESLGSDLLARDDRAQELFGVRLHSFDAAVERALREWEAVEELAAR